MRRRYGPWPLWLAAVVGSFAVLEYVAITRRPFLPLTYCLRHLMGISPRNRLGRVAPAVFAAFWAWVVVHLVRDAASS